MRLLAIPVLLLLAAGNVGAQPKAAPPFPAVSDKEVWGHLPPRKTPPLPEWAKVLAGPLPKTTAKMLELDYLHRMKNPLGLIFSAHIRNAVAAELQSKYGVAVAKADQNRPQHLDDVFLPDVKGIFLATNFARKLTNEGSAITDSEFASVLKHFGPEKTTAIVHTIAYANFHNRILLALGVKGESPIAPPTDWQFDFDAAKTAPPARPPWDDLKTVKADGLSVRVEWSNNGVDELNASKAKQQQRALRIPLPDKSVYDKLTEREKDSSAKIRWNTVSMGYQPEMTRAWFAVLYTFYEEAKPDRVFTNSVFWVVTRTNDCFY